MACAYYKLNTRAISDKIRSSTNLREPLLSYASKIASSMKWFENIEIHGHWRKAVINDIKTTLSIMNKYETKLRKTEYPRDMTSFSYLG